MICRKTMEPCRTPGMCAPYGGCQPSVMKEVSVRYSSESGAQVVENPALIPDLGQFVDYVWALKVERDELRAQVEVMRLAIVGLRSDFWLSCEDLPDEFSARPSVIQANDALQVSQ